MAGDGETVTPVASRTWCVDRHGLGQCLGANEGEARENPSGLAATNDRAASRSRIYVSSCVHHSDQARLLQSGGVHIRPRMAGASASALSLSRPAQTSLALRPTGLLSRPKRPLSRGFSPVSYPTKPLVSYRIYRHLSGWILPPLVIRAVGAHCH